MKDTINLTPIAVFAYDRLDHFEKMFTALTACNGFSNSPVTIFLDGAKSESDAPRVEEVREFARTLNLPNVTFVERENNMGLKASIYDGVGALCKKYGRVIVLEDDLIVSPCILDYFNAGLEKYKDESRIWSIVGYQYDVPQLRSLDRALILPFAHCWGWATWDRAWEQFDINAPVSRADLGSRAFKRFFDVDGIRDYTAMMGLALDGKINSWFIRWYYKVFSEHGVCVFPPVTYVANIGMGSGGTHSSGLSPYAALVKPAALNEDLIKFPEYFAIDYWAIDAIRGSWDARVQKMISFLGKVKRRVKGVISK